MELNTKIVGHFLSKFASMVISVLVVAAAASENPSEKAFFEKLLGSQPEEKMIGVMAVQTMLGEINNCLVLELALTRQESSDESEAY